MIKYKKRYYFTIFFIFIILPFLNSSAQTLFENTPLIFDRITGISNPSAISIFQDSKGFLWIGTWEGLNRYDGYEFKKYYYNDIDSSTISSQGIVAIAEDIKERLWFAGNNALNLYDNKKDKFVRFYNNPNDKYSLIGNDISTILHDSKGRLWIGTYRNGLCYLNTNNDNDYTKVKPRFVWVSCNNPKGNLSGKYVRSIFEDSKGEIWIIARNNIIDHYLDSSGCFEHFTIPEKMINKSYISELQLEDKDGLFWIVTRGNGLISWDRKNNKFSQFLPTGKSNSLPHNLIRCIWQDHDGKYWIGTDGKGISIFDPKKNTFQNYQYSPLIENSLSSNAIYKIFEDKSGIIWIATFNGELTKLNKSKTAFGLIRPNIILNNTINHKFILSILEDKDGNIWIGTDGEGLNYVDNKTGKFTYYKNNPDDPNSLSSNTVICLAEDKEGKIWIGTYGGGLCCYNKKNGKFKKYVVENNNPYSISHNEIWAIEIDNDQNVWAVSIYGTLNMFDQKTGRFYKFKNDPSDPNSFNEGYTCFMHLDKKNLLWIVTTRGLEMLDLNKNNANVSDPKLKFTHFIADSKKGSISSNNLYACAEDNKGNMWFGSDEGWINKYDRKTNTFIAFADTNNLYNIGIRSMIFDKNNYLWLGTTNGLYRYDIVKKRFSRYDASDGLQGNNFARAVYRLKDGRLCFGGHNGLNIFDPEKIPFNNKKPPVVITQFKVFNETVIPGEKINGYCVLNNSIEETEEITLPYYINYFSFVFSALDFTNPLKNKYAYKLEGFDRKWIYTDASHREAIYANLNPGTYTFMVKASNNDNVWNENPRKIIVRILPPWWVTWWFRIIVIAIIIISILLYIRIKTILYIKRQKELKQIIEQSTKELSEKNKILEEQQAKYEEQTEELKKYSDNLLHAYNLLLEKQNIIIEQTEQLKLANEQLKNLNATKDKLFSIIAHDLRNPFNVLIGLSDIMYRNYDKISLEKIKKYSEIISLTSKSGYNLLENLLQWSRSQTGTIAYTPLKLQLAVVVEETLDLLTAAAEKKNIVINQNISPEIWVYADEGMLMTILRNLISNAIKFTPEGGTITLNAKEKDFMVEISVSDTGVGITPDAIEKIFRIDVNYTTKGTNNESGTGLGLIVCKEFVEKHEGKIWVISEVNKGSTFFFTLPIG